MSILAFDLGASSGRALLGHLKEGHLEIEEIHRFSNDPVLAGQHLHWDILRLLHEIKHGILKARQSGHQIESIGIDSWAVDFGLLDDKGELLGNPYHYRDAQTTGIMEKAFKIVSQTEIFQRTGIQFMPINTIYHLIAMVERDASVLKQAATFLMIPDLLRYFLTGEKKNEFTNATSTQLFSPGVRDWDREMMQRFQIPQDIFQEVVEPGTVVGTLQPSVCEELDVPAIPVIAVAEHDTGAAVVAVPGEQAPFAYLSCGTWSLMGTELPEPVMNEKSLEWNFTNEGGYGQTYRLLKNIMGLWLIQESRRAWEKEGNSISFSEMVNQAEQAEAFRSFIDPDDLSFLAPTNMPEAIRDYCRKTKQPVPESVGQVTRCILESLAFKYRLIFERTEQLANCEFTGLHMVGGGINNELLCAFTANAIGKPVWAGPTEGSAIGNILVQAMTLGHIADITEARHVVRTSFPLKTYSPANQEAWGNAYEDYKAVTGI